MISSRKIGLGAGLMAIGGALMMARGDEAKRPAYPETPARPASDLYHGVEIVDPFRWLEDVTDPEVRAWAAAQTKVTRAAFDADAQRPALVERLRTLYDYQTTSAPIVRGKRYFFTRREGLKNQPIVYVREGSAQAEPRVVLDPNGFSQDGTVALDWMFPSPDGSLLAYGSSPNGSEMSTLKVLNVANGEHLTDTISRTRACTVAWEPSGQAFWYVRYPEKGTVPAGDEMYNRKIFRHVLGTNPENDPMVFGQGRSKIDWLGVSESEDGRFVVISSSTDWIKNDLYLKRLGDDTPIVPLAVGLEGQVDVAIFDGKVIIRTNAKTPRFQVLATDVEHLAPADWKEIIPEPDGGVIEAIWVVDRKIAVLTSRRAVSSLAVHDLDGRKLREIPLPSLGTVSGLNGEWDGKELFYSFQSFLYPATVFQLNLDGGEPVVIDRSTAQVDPGDYEVKQVTYPSKDGTKVPMFVLSKKGLEPQSKAPTLLYGYGGFDISLTPAYDADLRVWLDKGGVYAIANLRGGGELGREWHAAGRLGKKQNVFDDFIAAGEYLIKSGYTNPAKLAIEGGSNGGLLVSACLTQRPDLFRAVICAVPLCDMLRYHRFSIARNWIPEYGSADDPEAFAWLRAYSPYHNVKQGERFPAVLLLTGESDTRVEPMHAYKMAARLQAGTASDRPIYLRVESKAGHGAGKPLTKRIEEDADKWTFLFQQLSVP
ncbi:prolyl oligopeptidase [Singulisphaera sp. GP187]|nr:prolyl oligopeptidase [Singulisphaera sp. GP187]